MNVTQIISEQKTLLSQYGEIIPLGELKNIVISINQHYVEYVNSGGQATAYERRQVKNNMYKLFQAVEKLDFEQNGQRFEFSGPPIPPVLVTKQSTVPISADVYEPRKISNKSNQILHLGPENAKLHVYLENLVESTVYGAKEEEKLPWSVHVKNVKHCKIALRCDGPIILHNVESLVLILQCHQLRIHDMENCRIYTSVSNNRVIIESSKDLTFSGFRGVDFCVPSYAVDDFDWPTSEAVNLHYKMVTETENFDAEGAVSEASARNLLYGWTDV